MMRKNGNISLNKSIHDILVMLNVFDDIKEVIKTQSEQFQLYILKDLVLLTEMDIKEIYKENSVLLVSIIRECGYVFKDEHGYQEQMDEYKVLNTPINEMCLPVKACRSLNHQGIYTIEDLLKCSISNSNKRNYLGRYLNIGAITLRQIKEQIHNMGYQFYDEIEQERLHEMDLKDIPIDALDLGYYTIFYLKKAGIRSLKDLIGYSIFDSTRKKSILDIKFIGDKTVFEIRKVVHALGYQFVDEKIEKIEKNDKELKREIIEKKDLLRRYEYLTSERQKLNSQQELLDDEINEIIRTYFDIDLEQESKTKTR